MRDIRNIRQLKLVSRQPKRLADAAQTSSPEAVQTGMIGKQ
jgi:hypothetical protein